MDTIRFDGRVAIVTGISLGRWRRKLNADAGVRAPVDYAVGRGKHT